VILSSQIGPRIRELLKGRDQVEFNWLLTQIFECRYDEVSPIRREIAGSEMHDTGWIRSSKNHIWNRG
jgi:hypothetical protein